MRIAFAHYNKPEDISGVTSWLIGLALFLREQRCQVAVHVHDFCPADRRSPLQTALEPHGITFSRAPASGSLRRDGQATLAFLNRWRPDVFLPQCQSPHYLAAAVAGRAGLPWGFTLHSDDPDYWGVIESLPPQRYGGHSICVSRHLRTCLEQRGEEGDAVVIPYGVSLPTTRTRYGAEPFQVVYSGRLWEHQKRASLVVQSLIRACQRGEGRMRATLIGDGYSRAPSEEQVKAAGQQERITFTGRLPFAGVQEILLRSQAILLMSDFEGLPVALLEAMAAGVVPVVRAIASGIPEVVIPGETGLLVGEDPEEAATALLRLAQDPALWERCSQGARQLVAERFSRDNCHRQWLELLTNLAAPGAPRYPIRRLQGVRLGQLSAPLLAPYQRPGPWRTLAIGPALATGSARLKAAIKAGLRPAK